MKSTEKVRSPEQSAGSVGRDICSLHLQASGPKGVFLVQQRAVNLLRLASCSRFDGTSPCLDQMEAGGRGG